MSKKASYSVELGGGENNWEGVLYTLRDLIDTKESAMYILLNEAQGSTLYDTVGNSESYARLVAKINDSSRSKDVDECLYFFKAAEMRYGNYIHHLVEHFSEGFAFSLSVPREEVKRERGFISAPRAAAPDFDSEYNEQIEAARELLLSNPLIIFILTLNLAFFTGNLKKDS